ncbi:MAG: hypothetical protein WC091_20965 [Sulfuricellaceae bacterium]
MRAPDSGTMFPEVAQQLDMTFMAEFYAIEPFFMSNKKKFSSGLSANALGNFPVSSLKNADTAETQRNTELLRRVGRDVTAPTPHRTGRAQLRLPVPQCTASLTS